MSFLDYIPVVAAARKAIQDNQIDLQAKQLALQQAQREAQPVGQLAGLPSASDEQTMSDTAKANYQKWQDLSKMRESMPDFPSFSNDTSFNDATQNATQPPTPFQSMRQKFLRQTGLNPDLSLKENQEVATTGLTQAEAAKNVSSAGTMQYWNHDTNEVSSTPPANPGDPAWEKLAPNDIATNVQKFKENQTGNALREQGQQNTVEQNARQFMTNIRGDKALDDIETSRDGAIKAYNLIQNIKSQNRAPTQAEYYDLIGQLWKANTGASPTDQAIKDMDMKTGYGQWGKLAQYMTGQPAPATTSAVFDSLQDFVKDRGLLSDQMHDAYMAPRLIKPAGLAQSTWDAMSQSARGLSFASATGVQPTGSPAPSGAPASNGAPASTPNPSQGQPNPNLTQPSPALQNKARFFLSQNGKPQTDANIQWAIKKGYVK